MKVGLLLVGFGRLFEALMTKPIGYGFGCTKVLTDRSHNQWLPDIDQNHHFAATVCVINSITFGKNVTFPCTVVLKLPRPRLSQLRWRIMLTNMYSWSYLVHWLITKTGWILTGQKPLDTDPERIGYLPVWFWLVLVITKST